MKIRLLFPLRRAVAGFTLVELMVSTALIAAIMLLLLGTVDQTQRVWQRQQSKTAQFQSARAAFDAMTRRLSQATLNTYWKAHEASIAASADKAEFKFRRQSELQFVSGPTARFFSASPKLVNINDPIDENYPGHAMFFAAPLGQTEYVDPSAATNPGKLRSLRSLDSALTACGYFVEFGDDPSMPAVLRNNNPPYPPRFRYRLMEMMVPTESYNVYWRDDLTTALTWDVNPRIYDETKSYYDGMVDKNRQPITKFVRPLWMAQALTRPVPTTGDKTITRFQYAHSIAENIVALIVLPKLAVKDRVRVGTTSLDPNVLELAPKYEFDSWRVLAGGTESDPNHTSIKLDNRARDNLLPPIVQLTMVAIDEPSAIRMGLQATGKPNWLKNLFTTATTETQYIEDIDKLEKAIRDDPDHRNIHYRVFTTDVIIRGSKWSREPK